MLGCGVGQSWWWKGFERYVWGAEELGKGCGGALKNRSSSWGSGPCHVWRRRDNHAAGKRLASERKPNNERKSALIFAQEAQCTSCSGQIRALQFPGPDPAVDPGPRREAPHQPGPAWSTVPGPPPARRQACGGAAGLQRTRGPVRIQPKVLVQRNTISKDTEAEPEQSFTKDHKAAS